MKYKFKLINHVWKGLYNNKYLISCLGIVFLLFWANTFHTNFSDEFDNIAGGWYINHHRLPYVDFFSHHNPTAHYIVSLIIGKKIITYAEL